MMLYKCECGNKTYNNVCTKCGMVLNEHNIVNLPERTTDNDELLSGSAIKPTSPDMENHTVHSKWTSNSELKRAFKREKYYTDNDSEFWDGNLEIKAISNSLGLPQHIENEAIITFKKLIKKDFFSKYHIKENIYGACIKYACLVWKRPIQIEEISEVAKSDSDKIRRAFFILRREFNSNYKPCSLEDILYIYTNKFNLSDAQKTEIVKIGKATEEMAMTSGKSLFGYAAAIIYLYMKSRNLEITRDEIAKKMNVTPHTITTRKREVKKLWS